MSTQWTDDDMDEDQWAMDGDDGAKGSDAGTPLPYQDPSLTEELQNEMSELPPWFGMRWRDIAVEDQPAAWEGLRDWVDWLVVEYRTRPSVIPRCWFRHPEMTAELYAAMCAEYKVYEEGAPGVGPMTIWHTYLAQMKGRLEGMVNDAGCTPHTHTEPIAAKRSLLPFELDYEEEEWRRVRDTVSRTATVQRHASAVTHVRVAGTDGQEDAGLSIVPGTRGDAGVRLSFSGVGKSGAVEVKVESPTEHAEDVHLELSTDAGNTWQTLDEY